MSIEVSIIYSPEGVRLEQTSCHFPESGGTLGRGTNNFWVLDDPNKYMSSVHAKISAEGSQYLLTDMSTNGTFINDAAVPVGKGNKVVLNDGDHFSISDYQFVVRLSASAAVNSPSSIASNNDPFADIPVAAKNDPFAGTSNNDPFSEFGTPVDNNDPFSPASLNLGSSNAAPSLEPEPVTDPLILLEKETVLSSNNGMPSSLLNNSITASDFADPTMESGNAMNESIEWPKASAESHIIPDDWDDDFGLASEPPVSNSAQTSGLRPTIATDVLKPEQTHQALSSEPLVEKSVSESISANIDPATLMHSEEAQQPEQVPVSVTNVSTAPQTVGLPQSALNNVQAEHSKEEPVATVAALQTQEASCKRSEAEFADLERQNQQLLNEVAELKRQLQDTEARLTNTTVNKFDADSSAALNILVDAMGLSKWKLTDSKKAEINEIAGLLMRETMQGMMRVLQFRKKIKEEFRINVTTIQSVENNPLKFSANIDDALENMFIKENNAYKKPVEAVKEGFQSIAEHEVAVVAGMQAAFKGLIERFNPVQLENGFEKSSGLLSLGKNTRCWNAYKEYHQGLVENLDDSFQHLFGYDFVQAYEEQMQSLILARVKVTDDN